MRPLGLIISGSAAAVLGHEASHHAHGMGYCQSPMSGSFPLLSSPMCSSDTFITKYQAALGHGPAERGWTGASSCTANGTKEYCIFASSTFAEGRGLVMVTSPERAEYVTTLPAFADEHALVHENKGPDSEVAPFELAHVPGKGMGVVARRPIYRGDHLMSFTPAIVIDNGVFEDLTAPDIERMQTEAADRLPGGLRSIFMNLSTHDGVTDHAHKVDKILRTNAFNINIGDDNEYGLYVVFPEVSRFNHDCRPNADYWFDPKTLVQHVYATRPIAVGEEISLTYLDPIRTRAKRQKKLQRVWGFKCTCSRCSQRPELTAASDERIKQIRQIRKHLEDYTTESAATPQMVELYLSLYEQERLDGAIYEAYAFAAIEWNGVGEPWQAVRYARLAIEYGLAAVGPNDTDVVEMKSLAQDPWGHWSWMLRTSKRMSWDRMREVGTNYMRDGAGPDDDYDYDDDFEE